MSVLEPSDEQIKHILYLKDQISLQDLNLVQHALSIHFGITKSEIDSYISQSIKLKKIEEFQEFFYDDMNLSLTKRGFWLKRKISLDKVTTPKLSLKLVKLEGKYFSSRERTESLLNPILQFSENDNQNKCIVHDSNVLLSSDPMIREAFGSKTNLELNCIASFEVCRYHLTSLPGLELSGQVSIDCCRFEKGQYYIVGKFLPANDAERNLIRFLLTHPVRSKVIEFLSRVNSKIYNEIKSEQLEDIDTELFPFDPLKSELLFKFVISKLFLNDAQKIIVGYGVDWFTQDLPNFVSPPYPAEAQLDCC